jgi:hypothetical protein
VAVDMAIDRKIAADWDLQVFKTHVIHDDNKQFRHFREKAI